MEIRISQNLRKMTGIIAGGDDRWHPTLPNIRINADSTHIEWYDIVNDTQVRNWTLPFVLDYGIGSGEGNVSSDGRYVALADATRMFIVDMDPQLPLASYASGNKRIGPAVNISDGGTVDWVSVSPSGKYAVVMYNSSPRVFDINPTTLALTPRALAPGSAICAQGDPRQGYLAPLGHADMIVNPFDNNEEVIIGQRQAGCEAGGTGTVQMIRLKDNTVTSLTTGTTATMSHISARNLKRPGWVYISYYDPANYQWDASGLRYRDELVALKIDGSGSVERLAHTHTLSSKNYYAEAHPVPSPDGTRVMWKSNWTLKGNGPSYDDVKTYVVDTRP